MIGAGFITLIRKGSTHEPATLIDSLFFKQFKQIILNDPP